jgi:hypothetical protein
MPATMHSLLQTPPAATALPPQRHDVALFEALELEQHESR